MARAVLVAALFLGLAGDYLVRAPQWGLNVALGLTAMETAALAFSLRPAIPNRPRAGTARWPWIAAAFFAAMWAVRDTELLLAADLLAALGLACLPLIPDGEIGLRKGGVLDLAAAMAGTAWRTATSAADLARHLVPLGPSSAAWRRAAAVGIGLLLAIPLVLIFSALFASADPLFEQKIRSLLGVELEQLLSHFVVAAILAWAAAGYLWTHAAGRQVRAGWAASVNLGGTQVVTALGAVALVFALFVAVQAGSLFGGEAFVRNRTGLTYAEYARRGFFQMLFAAGLALPLVYGAPFVAGTVGSRQGALVRGVMAAQLGLTTLVLASALWRLGLYVRAYGLTEDRLFGAAVLLWIALTIGVFVPTVLRGQPHGAVFGAIVSAVGVLALLNLSNPAALIANYNLSHQRHRTVDVRHLVELGADAVPAVAEHLSEVPQQERCWLMKALLERHSVTGSDWRSWNLGRARARKAVAGLESQVRSCT